MTRKTTLLALLIAILCSFLAFAQELNMPEQAVKVKSRNITGRSFKVTFTPGTGTHSIILIGYEAKPEMPDFSKQIEPGQKVGEHTVIYDIIKGSDVDLTKLDYGTEYHVLVLAANKLPMTYEVNTTIADNEIMALTLPEPPQNINVDLSGEEPVLTWDKSKSATTYTLDIATDLEFNETLDGWGFVDCGDINELELTGIPTARTLYLRLRAYNATGASLYSKTYTID